MKSKLFIGLSGLLVLLLSWGGASWFLSETSKQHFATTIESMALGKASSFVEVEVLNHAETFLGSSTEIKLIPTSALIDEDIEFQRFMLKRRNGPVFINQNGIEFGVARWSFSIIESELNSADQLLGEAIVDFSEKVNLKIEKSALTIANLTIEELLIDGVLDFANASFDVNAAGVGLSYRHQQFLISFADANLQLKSASPIGSSTNHNSQLVLITNKGELSLSGPQKKIPFTLQSNGSIWANNDTLSGDLQIESANGELLKLDSADASNKTDDLVMDVTLQFREFLTDGFWQAVKTQSEVFSLLQQVEWAMEDIETPEQQDFLRSLYLDVTRISLSQLHNPFGPMLIANRSKLAMKANLSQALKKDVSSHFSIGGVSNGAVDSPSLVLKGEMKVNRQMLNGQTLTLLDKWSNRRWFRQYETEFEADLAIRNQQLLLNNFLVSFDGLEAELSQAITDQ
jgi:hypothetical protein